MEHFEKKSIFKWKILGISYFNVKWEQEAIELRLVCKLILNLLRIENYENWQTRI
jgi:hypothetical protein